MDNRDRLFGLLAVVAVVIYMLACGTRPAWSPDSNRVVFAFYDQLSETTGLALYDLRTKQVSRIYETQEPTLFQPLWLGEQNQVLALAARVDDALDIIHIDLATGKDRLIKTIPAKEARTALMVPPVLVDGRYLFFLYQPNGEDKQIALHLFDLETNELKPIPAGTDHYLYQVGKKYFYLARGDNGVELGTMNTGRLKFSKLAMLDKQAYGEVFPGLAGTKDGSNLAVLAKRVAKDQGQTDNQKKDQDQFAVLVLNDRGKLLKEIPLPADTGCPDVTYLVYGPGERSLWIPALAPVKPEVNANEQNNQEYKFLLLEVNIERGNCSQVLEAYMGKDGAHFMQPSISPDGKYLAVEVLVPKDEKNSLLYLVDLTSPERQVTKIPVPLKPKPTVPPAE